MALVTLKSCHTYLKQLENAAELKRKMPASSNPRTLKEGLYEMTRLLGLEEDAFAQTEQLAALMGGQRFVMIAGEASVTDAVARVFDGSRLLLTVLIDPTHFATPTGGQAGAGHQQGGALAARASAPAPAKGESLATFPEPAAGPELPLDSLKPLLAGNTPLTCHLFRVLFEHLLAGASPAGVQASSVSLVNDLVVNKEQSRTILATALFVLGGEIDPANLMPFLMQQGLFGLPAFEHLVHGRNYCDAFYAFRHLERVFLASPETEETQLRSRLDRLNARLGARPCGERLFEVAIPDKAKVDSWLAAVDLLEAMALTPWSVGLRQAVSIDASHALRSASAIAGHFERFARGEVAKDPTNLNIADHLLAFARQFSADRQPSVLVEPAKGPE